MNCFCFEGKQLYHRRGALSTQNFDGLRFATEIGKLFALNMSKRLPGPFQCSEFCEIRFLRSKPGRRTKRAN